jgi:hypothetical protein
LGSDSSPSFSSEKLVWSASLSGLALGDGEYQVNSSYVDDLVWQIFGGPYSTIQFENGLYEKGLFMGGSTGLDGMYAGEYFTTRTHRNFLWLHSTTFLLIHNCCEISALL